MLLSGVVAITRCRSLGNMCESKAVLMKGGTKEVLMEDVVRVEVTLNGVKCIDIMGHERAVEGVRLLYADLMGHEIVLART